MTRALFLAALLFALPARATPELQFSAGLPFTFTTESGETDLALRLAAGWHFGRHVAGLGLSERQHGGLEPWAYYRTPAWEPVPRIGLVGLGELRVLAFHLGGDFSRGRLEVMPTLGAGALMTSGFFSVLASLTVGTPLPPTSPHTAEVAFLVTLIVGPPDIPTASTLGPFVRFGGGLYALSTPLRTQPSSTTELTLDAGARAPRGGAGLRLLGMPGLTEGTGRGGDAILGWYEHDLGTLGEELEVRGLAAVGGSFMPSGCGRRGGCPESYGPAAQVELGVLRAFAAWELTVGASGFVAMTGTPSGHAAIVGSGIVGRVAWNGGR